MAKKTSESVPAGVPADGGGATEEVREHRGTGEGAGSIGGCSTSGAMNWIRWNRVRNPPGNIATRSTWQRSKPVKAVLAEKTLEVDFFKGALQKVEARRQQSSKLWREGIYDQIREVMPLQGSLTIERMCQLAQVSRAGLYRSLQEPQAAEAEMEVRSAIQQIALEHRRRYGYRRISAELRRRGMPVNHKRVARIMREDNLLAVQPRQFVATTKSDHKLEVYLNLARRMKLTGIDQLWVADITYIRLKAEFVYLAVILDGFSRKVVGWALELPRPQPRLENERSKLNPNGTCVIQICLTAWVHPKGFNSRMEAQFGAQFGI